MTEKIYEDDEDVQRPQRHGFRRFLMFLLILALVLGVVLVAAYRDGTGFDALHRYFSYGSAAKKSGTIGYSYDDATNNRFAVLNDGLVVLSGAELQYLDEDGKQVCDETVSMTAPALAIGGGCAVAYDVGGTELYVIGKSGVLLHLTAEEDEPFIAATLNGKGWLAVTSEKKNYKGCVSVYDAKMDLVFAFNSSDRFVTNAYVMDSDNTLAAVTLGQKDSVFISNVVLYDLSATDPKANYDVDNGLVFDIGELNSQFTTVSDTCLTFAGSGGKVKGSYDYSGEYLREYDLTGDGFAALLLNRYQSGSVGRLVTVDADGKEIASLDVNSEVLSVSAAGRYLTVLYSDSCVIYNEELQEYAKLSGTDYAKEALMRQDGSVLLIAAEKASLFLP